MERCECISFEWPAWALLTTFPILRASPQRAVPPDESRAKESTARLVLQRTNSVFSLELSSSRSATNLPAIFSVKLLSPDDKLLAGASVSVTLTPSPRRFELTLDWIPRDSLNDAATARLFYEVRPTAAASSPESTFPRRTASFLPFPFDFRFSRFARHFRCDLLVALKTYNREPKTTPSARRQTIDVRKRPAPSAKSAIIPRPTPWNSTIRFVHERDWHAMRDSMASSSSVCSPRAFTVARSAAHAPPRNAMFATFPVQLLKPVFARACDAVGSAHQELPHGSELETPFRERCN